MRARVVTLGMLLAMTAISCAGTQTATTPAPTRAAPRAIRALLKEWEISTDSLVGSSGEITFTTQNVGQKTHEFVVFKTDLDPGKLPTKADGSVDEEGAGVKHIDEVEDVAPNATKTLKVSLEPGKYVLLCNRVANGKVHYKLGMRTAFTVR